MADRIIKGDSGNDVIIQNNAGSRKIEVTNSGDVEVTGDVKTTTVKATNLKANDGTAGLVIADSTGEATGSGGFKSVNVKATNLKANDGTAALEIADSTGDIGFTGNTNCKIKLPSSGGIYESDGSTEILTESSGAVTLKNVSLASTVIQPSDTVVWSKSAIIAVAGSSFTTNTAFTTVGNLTFTISSSDTAKVSKIIILWNHSVLIGSGSTHTRINIQLIRKRGSESDVIISGGDLYYVCANTTDTPLYLPNTFIGYDSGVNSSNDHTFEIQVRRGGGASAQAGDIYANYGGSVYQAIGIK